MKELFYSKFGGVIAFTAICALVAGGLGWATFAAVRLEDQQLREHAEAERADRMRLALWRLDSYVAPLIAVEDGRPFNHYTRRLRRPAGLRQSRRAPTGGSGRRAVAAADRRPARLDAAPLSAGRRVRLGIAASAVRQPVACLAKSAHPADVGQRHADPDAIAWRVETLPQAGCSDRGRARARCRRPLIRTRFFCRLKRPLAYGNGVRQEAGNQGQNADNDYELRQQTQSAQQHRQPSAAGQPLPGPEQHRTQRRKLVVVPGNCQGLGGTEALVNLSPMTALWTPTAGGRERLLLVRLVRIEKKEVCQGIVLDDEALRGLLAQKVIDLFPEARLLPVHEAEPPQPECTMTALPFQLDPGPSPAPLSAGWTPLRVGLGLAWIAAIVALLAVGLGGWSLIDLSQRRIRFVSAVTHELRTPLTTLQLYLDMLVNGLVRDEKQRGEYIQTLNAEANRLSRLVGNVLDFSRLENQRPRLIRVRVTAADLLAQVEAVWRSRCKDGDKELVVENTLGDETALCTDAELVQQILGNLLDNACKYSRGAADPRVWLRLRGDGRRVGVRDRRSRPRHSEIREGGRSSAPSVAVALRTRRAAASALVWRCAALDGTGRRRTDVATDVDGRGGVLPVGSSHRRELRWN